MGTIMSAMLRDRSAAGSGSPRSISVAAATAESLRLSGTPSAVGELNLLQSDHHLCSSPRAKVTMICGKPAALCGHPSGVEAGTRNV